MQSIYLQGGAHMASPGIKPGTIRFGLFELDSTNRELRKHGNVVKLQPQQFAVLQLLVEHAGQVVSRDEIRARIWDASTFVDFERAINFAINQIRVALGDDAEKPRFVETIPRLGYRFVCPIEVSQSAPVRPEAAVPIGASPGSVSAMPDTPPRNEAGAKTDQPSKGTGIWLLSGVQTSGASPAKSNVIGFGVYEFNVVTGELRKDGIQMRLEGQPLTILQMLLERPGELVTREELQKRLWPGETFVDFEHSLNAAVKRLRAALSDSADQPRYIETQARRGYRFIAPLDGVVASAEPVAFAPPRKGTMPYRPTLLHNHRGRRCRPFLPDGFSSWRWQRREARWRLAQPFGFKGRSTSGETP